MALDSTDPQNNPALLSQLLALLQGSQQNGGTAPNALLPNQSQNQAGQIFQLGAGGQATPENPGSSPEFSAPGTLTSLPTSGMSDQALQNWYNSNQGNTFYNSQGQLAGIPSESGGGANQGNSYGMAAPSQGGTPEPGTIRAMMNKGGILNGASLTNPQSDQFTQLLQGLVNKYQSTPANAAAAPVAPPPPPVAAAVPNNQVAYTPPSQAQIPGMQTLAQQVQAGTANPTAITAAGGPLTASTGSGIPQGSMPSSLQIPAQYIPRPADNAGTAQIVNTSGQAATPSPVASIGGGVSNALTSAVKMYQQQNPFSAASRSYGPGGTTQDLGSVDSTANLPLGVGGSNYSQGGLNLPSGADAPALGAGGSNYSQGGLDLGAESSGAADGAASVGGAGAASGAGSAAAGLISSIGSAIEKAYTPIHLRPIPQVQMPQSPVFTSPQMIG